MRYRFKKYGSLISLVIVALFIPAGSHSQQPDKTDEELFAKVAQHVKNKEYNQASKILGEIIKADKENAEAWQMLGYTLQAAGDVDRAIVIHKKAATFEAAKISAYYNLSCAYALKNQPKLSLQYLKKAIDGGFDDVNMINTDPELKSIRGYKEFRTLMRRFAKPARRVSYFRPTKLDGKWKVVSGAYVGKKLTPAQLPIPTSVTPDKIELAVGGKDIVMRYKLDLSKRPVEIDLKFIEGKEKNLDCKGIVDFNGDTVKLCYQSTGGARPKKYVSSPNDGNVLLVMRRISATIDRNELVGKWNFEKGFRGSETIDKKRLTLGILIGERQIRLPGTDGKTLTVHYQIDSTQKPATIDMVMTDSETGQRISNGLGIILLNNTRLMICYDSKGKVRPKKFATTKSDGFFLFTLKRAE